MTQTRTQRPESDLPAPFRIPRELVILCSPMAFNLLSGPGLSLGVGAGGLLLLALGTLPQQGAPREQRAGGLLITLVLAALIGSAAVVTKLGTSAPLSFGLALTCAASLLLPRLPATLAASLGTLGLLMMATLLITGRA